MYWKQGQQDLVNVKDRSSLQDVSGLSIWKSHLYKRSPLQTGKETITLHLLNLNGPISSTYKLLNV